MLGVLGSLGGCGAEQAVYKSRVMPTTETAAAFAAARGVVKQQGFEITTADARAGMIETAYVVSEVKADLGRLPRAFIHLDRAAEELNTYRRAIHRAVDLANRKRKEEGVDDLLPKWSPNRLRHSAATEIRRRFGLEAAQVTLGHAQADVTQVYAERDLKLAVEVMRKIG